MRFYLANLRTDSCVQTSLFHGDARRSSPISLKIRDSAGPSKTLERRQKFFYLARMEVGKYKATVVISRGNGQQGNRLFLFAVFYAASQEKVLRIRHPSFGDFAPWFRWLGMDVFCRPVGKATHSWLRGVFIRMCKVMENAKISLRQVYGTFLCGWRLACDKNSNGRGMNSEAGFLRVTTDQIFLPCLA